MLGQRLRDHACDILAVYVIFNCHDQGVPKPDTGALIERRTFEDYEHP